MLPLIVLFFLGAFLWALQPFFRTKERRESIKYHNQWHQLVERFDNVVVKLNDMALIAEQVRNAELLRYYEKCLVLFEQLLQVVAKTPAFGSETSSLHSALILVDECEKKIDRTFFSLKTARSGHQVDFEFLYGRRQDPLRSIKGCFFCSRPFDSKAFQVVKAKLKGIRMHVLACEHCRRRLEEAKKVDVLYLKKEGQLLHWSQVESFESKPDYWRMNLENTGRERLFGENLVSQQLEAPEQ